MASLVPIVSVAHIARPPRTAPLIGAALLVAIALMPWRHGQRAWLDGTCASPCGDASVVPDSRPHLTIEVPVPSVAAPNSFDRWGFADMRPWPAGMVIGMSPTIDDPMVLRTPGVFDRLLSALKTALLSIQI